MSREIINVFALNPAARSAIKAFRDSKPWQGTLEERVGKFTELHRGLCRSYDLETMLVRDDEGNPEFDGGPMTSAFSYYDTRANRIVLKGKLSAVTYLFLFGGAVGMTQPEALRWARDTFAHFFPRSFNRCRDIGGVLIQNREIATGPADASETDGE